MEARCRKRDGRTVAGSIEILELGAPVAPERLLDPGVNGPADITPEPAIHGHTDLDVPLFAAALHESGIGTTRPFGDVHYMSAVEG